VHHLDSEGAGQGNREESSHSAVPWQVSEAVEDNGRQDLKKKHRQNVLYCFTRNYSITAKCFCLQLRKKTKFPSVRPRYYLEP